MTSDFEAVEPQPEPTDCKCAACGNALVGKLTEAMMHMYVGGHDSNIQASLQNFETGLDYSSVVYWEVGYDGRVRYLLYRSEDGEFVAWFDNANKRGFRRDI
jgi:hypothetical protein